MRPSNMYFVETTAVGRPNSFNMMTLHDLASGAHSGAGSGSVALC